MSELLQIEFIDDHFTVDKSAEYQLLVRRGVHRSQMAIFNQQNQLLLLLSWKKGKPEERVNQLLSLTYHSKIISVETKQKALIPNNLYNSSQEIYYLNAFSLDKENHFLHTDDVKGFDAKCIYGVSLKEQQQLLSDFSDFTVKSISTVILNTLARVTPEYKDYLSINFDDGYTDFTYISDGKLIYHHSHPSQNADEFNYFLLAIVQEYGIDFSNVSMIVSGQIEPDDTNYQRLRKYSDQLSFLDLSGIIDCRNFNILKKSYQKLALFGLLCG
ncbi:DUF3822 family protein [Olivibacter sp. XZL3]|uniref:DUF3822 family protein n=1 Tax=Olivibacter sp. XZL3 TaxID=1735116 RepID=UPI0010652F54|nr:DUF3822 family protein [Olivibacter sp. XZL3]